MKQQHAARGQPDTLDLVPLPSVQTLKTIVYQF